MKRVHLVIFFLVIIVSIGLWYIGILAKALRTQQHDSTLSEPQSQSRQVVNPMESVNDKPFHERIHTVLWAGERCDVTFAGEQHITESKLGPINVWVDGLTFHPDGQIAFSYGNGATPDMMLAYWSSSGIGEPIVNLQYAKLSKTESGSALEKKGFFWFFSGPLAIGADGVCYFSLGSCNPNGLYKIISSSPVQIEKLYTLDSTRSLQIPLFDTHHLYSTNRDGIFRYPITPDGNELSNKPWFVVLGDQVALMNCLVVDPNQIIAEVVFRTPRNASNKNYVKSLVFDRNKKCFWALPVDYIGAMAISWDGQKMIRFDRDMQAIYEFVLGDK